MRVIESLECTFDQRTDLVVKLEGQEQEVYFDLDVDYQFNRNRELDAWSFDIANAKTWDEEDGEIDFNFTMQEEKQLRKMWEQKFEVEAEEEAEGILKDIRDGF